MGAQSSTVESQDHVVEDANTRNDGSNVSDEHTSTVVVRETTAIETVVSTTTSVRDQRPPPPTVQTATPSRPPAAPHTTSRASTTVADRVVSVRGTIMRAYPLNTVSSGDNNPSGGSGFSIGSGPCGRDATHVVAWEVQIRDSYESCFVFLYDKWARAVSGFQRRYKIELTGSGLVAIDHWDIGHDTEDVKRCYIVAESRLLKLTMERSPRLLPKPQGITINLAYEEPQQVPESDQVRYLPVQTIRAESLYDPEGPHNKDTDSQKELQKMMAKPNPRGKRSLRTMANDEIQAAQAAKKPTPSSYMYTPLADLIPGYANLFGVVVNMSLPKRSEGQDYYMTLHIVDESCPRREDAIQVMVFLPTLEQMPRVQYVGDIVRFHKIRINRYHDRLQGVCSSRATRYLVLRRDGDDIDQQTSTEHWTFEKYDQERFRQLVQWADRSLGVDTTLPPGCPQASRLLGDMQYAEAFADVVVRVLHVQEPYGDFTAARLILWDGSGDASSCQDLYAKLRRERDARPNSVSFVPETGLLMEVVVDSCWIVMQNMGIIPKLTTHWCRFRNLAVSAEQGEPTHNGAMTKHWYELHFREVSSVMFVPETIPEVQIRESHVHGVEQDVGFEPEVEVAASPSPVAVAEPVVRVTTSVPAFIMDKVPVASIHTILTSVHVPRKYHCNARVVKFWPSAIEQIAKVKPGTTDYVYSFVMRLQDASGEVDAIVHGEDAAKFLHGIPPCDLSKNTSSRALLEKRLRALVARTDPLHYCIKSYKTKDATTSDSSEMSVRFRLFDTTLQVAQ